MNVSPIVEGKRQCSSCQSWKFLEDFVKHKQGRYGIGNRCKECDKLKAREQRKKHKEKINSIKRMRYHLSPKQDRSKYNEWRKANKELVNEKERLRYAQSPEARFSAKQKDYKRRIILKSRGHISFREWKDLCNKYGNKCLRCGKSDIELTLDHVVPVKLGGLHLIENAQPLCFSCNSSKGAKFIDYRTGLS